jgi:hypothetical protein
MAKNENLKVTLKEIEVNRLNLTPGDILTVKMQGSDFMDEDVIQSLKNQMQLLFPNNKVIMLSYPIDHAINFEITKGAEPAQSPCSVANFCQDCSCGKKEIALAMKEDDGILVEQMEQAARNALVGHDETGRLLDHGYSPEEIEDLAIKSELNAGPAESIFDPASQEWLMYEGKLTEAGIEVLYKSSQGVK